MNRRVADLEHAEAKARIEAGDDIGEFIKIHADPEVKRICPTCMATATGSILDDAPTGTRYRIGVVGPSTFVQPIELDYAMARAHLEQLIFTHAREKGTIIGIEIQDSKSWQLYAVIPCDGDPGELDDQLRQAR